MENIVTRYIVGRCVQACLVLWGAYTVTYLILYLLPGDTLSILLTASGMDINAMTPDQMARARAYFGLNQGPVEQYFSVIWGMLHGDFGHSATKNAPVWQLIAERLPQTLQLGGLAVILSIAGGIVLGYALSAIRWQPLKNFMRRLPALGCSVPAFWTGLLLIQVFAFTLGWFPSTGNDGFRALVLPAVTLAMPGMAVYGQVLLRGIDEIFKEPYIVTAFAKGLSRREVRWRHSFKNASLPLLTLAGLQIGNTFSGAVLVETVFSRVGLGRLAQEAVLRQDIPVVLAIVTLSAVAFVVVNLAVDLLYPLLDPRIGVSSGPAEG